MKRSRKKTAKHPHHNHDMVRADETYAGEDFEDKLYLFWEKYRTGILIATTAVLVATIGYNLMVFLAGRKERALQSAFQAAETNEALIAFAESNPQHPLAGFAYLEAADDNYRDSDFAEAVNYYEEAVEPLENTPLAGRARLGYAMALIRKGDLEGGQKALREVENDGAELNGTRSEAAFNLAVSYWETENFEEVKKHLDFIANLENTGYWSSKAERLRGIIPELRDSGEEEK